jgi:hypothetical protein
MVLNPLYRGDLFNSANWSEDISIFVIIGSLISVNALRLGCMKGEGG